MRNSTATDRNHATSGTGALRFGAACFFIATLPFVWQGVVAWRDDDRLRDVVIDFFQALADGRRDAARTHLSPDLQQQFSQSSPSADQITRDVHIQIVTVDQNDDRATVKVSIGKQGFSLKPTVRLKRVADAAWKIIAIDGGDTDPRWQKMQGGAPDEGLADQLAEKLQAGG